MPNPNSPDTIIQVHSLSKRYPKAERAALDAVSLSIRTNEFFGLLGPNGSGKTTMISILCGLLPATSGEVVIDGHLLTHGYRTIKQLVALVPQEIALYKQLSLYENLRYFGGLYGLHGKPLKQRMHTLIERTGLQEFAHKPIQTYSGGMQRRANIIASLLHQPKILFLDEPTANVDPQSRNMIFGLLKELQQQGMTLIYTSHHMDEIEQLCQRVAIIDMGHFIAQASPKELVAAHPGCHNLGDVFLHLTGRALRDVVS